MTRVIWLASLLACTAPPPKTNNAFVPVKSHQPPATAAPLADPAPTTPQTTGGFLMRDFRGLCWHMAKAFCDDDNCIAPPPQPTQCPEDPNKLFSDAYNCGGIYRIGGQCYRYIKRRCADSRNYCPPPPREPIPCPETISKECSPP